MPSTAYIRTVRILEGGDIKPPAVESAKYDSNDAAVNHALPGLNFVHDRVSADSCHGLPRAVLIRVTGTPH